MGVLFFTSVPKRQSKAGFRTSHCGASGWLATVSLALLLLLTKVFEVKQVTQRCIFYSTAPGLTILLHSTLQHLGL